MRWKYGVGALLIIGLLATAAIAMPFGKGKGDESMQAAFEAEDYDAYLEALDENDREFMAQKMTEERFNTMVEHQAQCKEQHEEMQEIREEIGAAIDAGDYSAWKAAVEKRQITSKIGEDNFDQFLELHEAREEGDYETAQEIAEGLGLPERACNRHRLMGRMHGGMI
mgnify:CR=1 FL=1